jgi:hypothetical protein
MAYIRCVMLSTPPICSMPGRYGIIWTAGRTAKKLFKRPGTFALAVIKQFRANQCVLLAGAVAYYSLLSLPLHILILTVNRRGVATLIGEPSY